MAQFIDPPPGHCRPDIVRILQRQLSERPVEGETYSLYGDASSTDGYFHDVSALAEQCLEYIPDPGVLLRTVREAPKSHRQLKRISKNGHGSPELHLLLNASRQMLARYTRSVAGHLQRLPLRARFDRTLSMIEEQYHLAMLEIELVNSIHARDFARARTKLAFLPHCLRDWSRDCQSTRDGHDYVCKGCSKSCWVNGVSKMLRLHGITPYIWMSADLSRLFRNVGKHSGDLGVLGIACVPELMHGMRLCTRHNIPVVGIPLNANRCGRWMGAFHDNSVNLNRLAAVIGDGGRQD